MSSYGVLGATGNVGQSLLTILSQSPENKIHAYVRSESKLRKLLPDINNITIFEGALHDIDLLSRCIKGTKAVFLAVAINDNQPGCTIAQDTAHMVVAALEKIKNDDVSAHLPRLVILSSASLEEKFSTDVPALFHQILFTAAYHIYTDLQKAENFLRSQSWITSTFVKPGGLVHDAQSGHEVTTERSQTFLSFLDLAAGMVEVADGRDKWKMENVSVVPTSKNVKTEWRVPLFLMAGLLSYYFPFLYPLLKS